MTSLYFAAASFILVMVALGLLRILVGPSASDRLMAAQLIGSGGVAIVLLLAAAMKAPSIIDVALMLAILAVFASVGFVNWGRDGDAHDG
ncbi:MAG: monovalent cation/H+ antiporter complex subunit F [Hyphomicrobiales bacterium]